MIQEPHVKRILCFILQEVLPAGYLLVDKKFQTQIWPFLSLEFPEALYFFP